MSISLDQRHFQQLTSPFCVCDCTRIPKLNDIFLFYVESWAKELMNNPCFPTSKVAFHLVTQQLYKKCPSYCNGQQYNPNWLQHMGNNNTIAIHTHKQSNIHIYEPLLVINHFLMNNITTFSLMTIIIFNVCTGGFVMKIWMSSITSITLNMPH
jgi:hypothetical protein